MRREKYVEITTNNRDIGKRFKLTEMPACDSETWAAEAALAVSSSSQSVPADFLDQGMLGLLAFGLQAITTSSIAKIGPLADQMLRCAEICPDPTRPTYARPWIKDDFEEVSTLLFLRREVLDLHLNFSLAEEWSAFLGNFRAMAGSRSSDSQTSLSQSAK